MSQEFSWLFSDREPCRFLFNKCNPLPQPPLESIYGLSLITALIDIFLVILYVARPCSEECWKSCPVARPGNICYCPPLFESFKPIPHHLPENRESKLWVIEHYMLEGRRSGWQTDFENSKSAPAANNLETVISFPLAAFSSLCCITCKKLRECAKVKGRGVGKWKTVLKSASMVSLETGWWTAIAFYFVALSGPCRYYLQKNWESELWIMV